MIILFLYCGKLIVSNPIREYLQMCRPVGSTLGLGRVSNPIREYLQMLSSILYFPMWLFQTL